ncbi:ATP-dependent Clp protease ATP-binding subunit [Candidatus Saccharibacteria bacterium]|nr:ATP-dependent Clp protease ATP-binding subunit [Candidatus Saccharibacteria bacterium]
MIPEDFQEIISRMSENSHKSLERAEFFSRKFKTGYIGIEHILLGILANRESSAATLAYEYGLKFEDLYDFFVENPPISKSLPDFADPNVRALTDRAVFALKMASLISGDDNEIGTKNLLFSILKQKDLKLQVVLRQTGADIEGLVNAFDILFSNENSAEGIDEIEQKSFRKNSEKQQSSREIAILKKFGEDLTEKAKNGELDPVIGRETEVQRLIMVLLRRTKSNPVLIGEAGVGKTAVVELLAQKISKEQVPSQLIGKRIFEIDLAGMLAGTKFRGQFEERLKNVIKALEKYQEIIAFIDEIHLLAGTGSAEGAMDAANILKPALARGKIKLIGATTFDEFKKSIEKDSALNRRFQSVQVEEPSLNETIDILKGLREKYEKYHNIEVSDEVLGEIADMSARYIFDRQMPDKAIDILDEAGALAASEKVSKPNKILEFSREIEKLNEKQIRAAENEDFEGAALYKTRISQLKKKLGEEELKAKSSKKIILTSDYVARAISLKTNIPVQKISKNQAKILQNLEKHLSKKVIGQSEAIEKISKAIRRNKSGISDEDRPIGSFIFLGPTGVGKTELSRQLANEVFGGSKSLIKIDMSEFGEKHKTSQLLGAPAGYVGYGEGGTLTEKIRRQPYSVVLFDEIEKAHPDTFNLLLQLLEDGELTDSQGRKVSFKNTVVILTSNLGASEMMNEKSLGFEAESSSKKNHSKNEKFARKALEKVLKPELLNRFDGIITFQSLSKTEIGKIFDILLADLNNRLLRKGLNLKVRKSAKDFIIEKGYDAKNGARPLRRAIEDLLEHKLAEEILVKNPSKGTQFVASVKNGEIIIEVSED